MRKQSNDTTYFDQQLKRLDQDIIWKEGRKDKLGHEIYFAMGRQRSKRNVFTKLKYVLSLGIMAAILFFGYHLLSDNIISQHTTGNEGNQDPNHLVTNENPNDEEKEEIDKVEEKEENTNDNEADSSQAVEDINPAMELHTGTTETVMRGIEGMEQEVEVINYEIEPYGIAYQLDANFEAPDLNDHQISYSILEGEYRIELEVIANTTIEAVISELQEKFLEEGFEEEFELESTPADENDLNGKMQFFGHNPIKGFIVYEIEEQVLAITFYYPSEGGDGMFFLLEALRKSIHIE